MSLCLFTDITPAVCSTDSHPDKKILLFADEATTHVEVSKDTSKQAGRLYLIFWAESITSEPKFSKFSHNFCKNTLHITLDVFAVLDTAINT